VIRMSKSRASAWSRPSSSGERTVFNGLGEQALEEAAAFFLEDLVHHVVRESETLGERLHPGSLGLVVGPNIDHRAELLPVQGREDVGFYQATS
jgi:hypothetical protein